MFLWLCVCALGSPKRSCCASGVPVAVHVRSGFALAFLLRVLFLSCDVVLVSISRLVYSSTWGCLFCLCCWCLSPPVMFVSVIDVLFVSFFDDVILYGAAYMMLPFAFDVLLSLLCRWCSAPYNCSFSCQKSCLPALFLRVC